MGNQLGLPQRFEQDHLADVPFVVFKEQLGGGRLLKTVLCRHDKGGQVVVKVYQKRGDVDIDKYEQQLKHIRSRLSGLPSSHVWPFQHYFSTEKAAYLVRQHIFANLYNRLSTRPFFAGIEKHWIAYQLLHAVAQSHEQGICHGDIKCENILITSWHWIFLADFASYKPAYLPADNPADFSFFFDTGGRRRCYLAPERFFSTEVSSAEALADAPLQPSMDIFSLGCVLAELFLDGQRLFDLSDLLAYKAGKFDPTPTLSKVEEPFRELILHMINVDPGQRSTALHYLQEWGPKLFPSYFDSVLHPFFSSILLSDAESKITAIDREFPSLLKTVAGVDTEATPSTPVKATLAGDGDARVTSNEQKSGQMAHDPKAALAKLADGLVVMSDNLQQKKREPRMPQHLEEASAPEPLRPDPADARSVVIEETYEFQCRELKGGFGPPARKGHEEALAEWQPPRTKAKETIYLPPDSGWQWTEEWHIDREGATDSTGWVYRVNLAGTFVWSPKCVVNCHWRQRKWTRQRRKVGAPDLALKKGMQDGSWKGPNSHGFVIIATLLCSTIRGSSHQESKARAVRLLTQAASYCDDETRLQRIIPYLMDCMTVPLCMVKWTALQGLVQVLGIVQHLPPSDARVFTEYILPSLSMVPNDKEEWMLVAYAQAIGLLAASAQRFLVNTHLTHHSPNSEGKYTMELSDTREKVEKVLHEMLASSRSTSNVKQAVLSRLGCLATFLGSKETNDFLLPSLLAFLNSPDWRLKSSFLAAALNLAYHAGPTGVESYLLPCLPQALKDSEAFVVAQAVSFLAETAYRHFLRRTSLLGVLSAKKDMNVLPVLLKHESAAVRQAAISFLMAAASRLSSTDLHVFLKPRLESTFPKEPASLTKAVDILKVLPSESDEGVTKKVLSQKRHKEQGNGVHMKEKPVMMINSSANVYSIRIERSHVAVCQSFLSAALQHCSKHVPEAERSRRSGGEMLLAKARRMARASPDMQGLHPGLVPALQLGSEEALSFQADSARGSPANSAITSAIDAAIHTNLPTNMLHSALDTTYWKPRGVLIMHMAEHRQAVNKIAVSESGAYFASASDDGTVKIWDSRRLEKDAIFRSRLTYQNQAGRILGCTACKDDQSMVSASSDGSLHLWHVEYTSKARQTPDRYISVSGNELANPGEGSILTLERWNSTLVYATERGIIHGLDLRTKAEAWRLTLPASGGLWQCLVLDKKASNWMALGSIRGCVAVWDMRFQMCVKEWTLKDGVGINAMSHSLTPPLSLGLSPSSSSPLVYISSQAGDTSLWELQSGKCHQVLTTNHISQAVATGQSQRGSNKSRNSSHAFATPELQGYATEPLQGVHAILPMAGGRLLTGSADGCIRYWDAGQAEQSYMVCGPPTDLDTRGQQEIRTGVSYAVQQQAGHQVVTEHSLMSRVDKEAGSASSRMTQRRAAVSHADTVLDLCELNLPGDKILLSGSADGIVKAWK